MCSEASGQVALPLPRAAVLFAQDRCEVMRNENRGVEPLLVGKLQTEVATEAQQNVATNQIEPKVARRSIVRAVSKCSSW